MALSSHDIAFEWLDDSQKWNLYGDGIQLELVTAVLKGQTSCKVKVPPRNALVNVNFDKMTQTNTKTKWERLIRCCIKNGNEENEWNCWEWENDSKFFTPYSVKVSLQMEEQFLVDKKVKIILGSTNYEADLDNMVQANTKSGFSRNIRRIQSTNEHKVVVDASTIEVEPKVEASGDIKPDVNGSSSKSAGSESSSKRGRKRKTDENGVDDNDDEMDDDVKSEKRSKSGKSVGGTLSSGTKKIVFSEKVPVDDECVQKKNTSHVLVEPGGAIWDAMLNQTNVGNNNNKYYLLQLLEDNNAKNYHVWFRWGRVGYKGQNSLQSFGPDLDRAKAVFTKKFSDKTLNEWADRKNFEKHHGKYDLVAIDYGNSPKKAEKKEENGVKKEITPSKLDKKVYELMETICNITTMENTVKELEYDLSKAPLGKLTSAQIKAGYAAIDTISKLIDQKITSGPKLSEACNQFYTRIPHAFGFKVPPIINSIKKIKEKLDLLDALSEIEIAMNIIKSEGGADENPVDFHYSALKCGIKPLDKSDKIFDLLEKYLQNTHGSTHTTYKMEVEEIFRLDKADEKENFKDDLGNRHLLWHGSRQSNVVGILSHGLKIAPPEAPVTGYMFGKGVYFADMSSKSANYCFPSPANTTGFVLLCDVALGNCNPLVDADYQV